MIAAVSYESVGEVDWVAMARLRWRSVRCKPRARALSVDDAIILVRIGGQGAQQGSVGVDPRDDAPPVVLQRGALRVLVIGLVVDGEDREQGGGAPAAALDHVDRPEFENLFRNPFPF